MQASGDGLYDDSEVDLGVGMKPAVMHTLHLRTYLHTFSAAVLTGMLCFPPLNSSSLSIRPRLSGFGSAQKSVLSRSASSSLSVGRARRWRR